MDYDESDFQNQNFQLKGEDSNRFSSGLRPFSLPKFEVDDHFQVDLRFDGLAEPDSLIDIQDQDERNWIEDFSTNNASLDFNPVSRRKNVWSEATSSESVEILLNSVGDDDVNLKRASFISSASQNELINVDNHPVPVCFQEDVKVTEEEPVRLAKESKKQFTKKKPIVTMENMNLVSSSSDEVITGISDVPIISKEQLPDGRNTSSGSCKLDGNFVEKDASVVIVEEPQVNNSEKEPDNLTLNTIAVGRGSEVSRVFVSRLSRSVSEALPEFDMKMKQSPLLLQDYEKHEITEKDGLLEDVAHQIENLGKVNSSVGQGIPLHDQATPEINSVESSGFDDATKSTLSAKTGSLDSNVENNAMADDPLRVEETVTVSEEEDALALHTEIDKNVGKQVGISGHEENTINPEERGKEETDARDPGSCKVKFVHRLPKSPETQQITVNEEDQNDGMNIEEGVRAEEKVVLEIDEKSGNNDNLQQENGNSSKEKNGGTNVELAELNAENSKASGSDDLKSDIIERPVESSSHHRHSYREADTERFQIVETAGQQEKTHQLADLQPVEDDPSALDPVCGSPTVIGNAESNSGQIEEQELRKQSPEQPSESAPAKDFGENNSSEPKYGCSSEERTFTFNVGSRTIPEESPVARWKTFSALEPLGTPKNEKMSSTASTSRKANKTELRESHPIDVSAKKAHKDKSRAVSSGPIERSSSKKRSTIKETSSSIETSVNRDLGEGEEKHQQPSTEGGGPKQSELLAGPTLVLPPFTDEQQVQLRAQIYVYGYLIQGIPPDEACMVAAFGNNDNTRSSWEGTWRGSLEKFRGPKSPSASFATPLPSHAGPRAQEQTPRSVVQAKPPATPINMTSGRSVGKCSSPVLSNLIPSPSAAPAWQDASQSTISRGPLVDPSPIFSPVQPLPPSQSKHSLPSGSTSWLPPTPVPFVAPSIPLVHDKGTTLLQKETTMPISVKSLVPVLEVDPGSEKKTASANTSARKKKKVDDSPGPEQETTTTRALEMAPATSAAVVLPSAPSPTRFQVLGEKNRKEQRVTLSDETGNKIELSRLQAEDAIACSEAAVRHSEGIWAQLAIQRDSGQASEIEAKLAAAAVAAAAASSVAKAAAAAAKVASDAAMQAKLMADEAVASKTVYADQLPIVSAVSIISAAKEAARRRVEAASAASKRAENLDAIVRAAELAAVAVCQAGAVVAMGDPLPFTLKDLIEAGPEGHWKVPSNTDLITNSGNEELVVLPRVEEDSLPEAVVDLTEPVNIEDRSVASLNDVYIQEGSLVEVLLEKDNARIWYSANVLRLKDGKAFVSYNDLPPDTDREKEWIPLEGQVDQPPRVRLAHPCMTTNYERTRKRRRAAASNYLWAVGDRVDASIRNGWCEGVVTEKNKEDETKLTVHFSGGEILTIRAWQLRSSLVWKDGHWVEWSTLRENSSYAYEGDTPKDKRQKVTRPEGENYPKFKGVELSKEPATIQQPTEPRPPLSLSEKEKIFSFGKSDTEIIANPPRRMRSGPKDSGPSRVVFGVPKPGKKRKLVEVSKHYDKSEPLTKYLPPAASKSRKVPDPRPPKPERAGSVEHEPPSSTMQFGANPVAISKKKASTAIVTGGRAVERASSEERHGGGAPELAGELRRSNRRIQPTSRLLEGLQSSMITAKIASVVDKSTRTSSRRPPSSRADRVAVGGK